MNPEDFIQQYESALASQNWNKVSPLVHNKVSVTFSDGSTHIGQAKVEKAFKRNFSLIENENYQMKNIFWLHKADDMAVYLFNFHWTGRIKGKLASGQGKGTSVLLKEEGKCYLLCEHLSRV
ncbi:MAG: nuclear transport factor 2 family protein [Bacteroidota bacterium]